MFKLKHVSWVLVIALQVWSTSSIAEDEGTAESHRASFELGLMSGLRSVSNILFAGSQAKATPGSNGAERLWWLRKNLSETFTREVVTLARSTSPELESELVVLATKVREGQPDMGNTSETLAFQERTFKDTASQIDQIPSRIGRLNNELKSYERGLLTGLKVGADMLTTPGLQQGVFDAIKLGVSTEYIVRQNMTMYFEGRVSVAAETVKDPKVKTLLLQAREILSMQMKLEYDDVGSASSDNWERRVDEQIKNLKRAQNYIVQALDHNMGTSPFSRFANRCNPLNWIRGAKAAVF